MSASLVGSEMCIRDRFWPGLRVVACCRGRKLRNGREYETLRLGIQVPVQAEGEEPIKLKRSEFFRSMRLRYA
eukprot:6529580-Alexandrium_andersonii.AAC.1